MKHKSKKYNLAKIKVVGIGGAGNNAVSRMFDYFPRQVDLIAINTDVQDLNYTNAKKKIHIGKNLTKGLGTGMNPNLGRQAAEENRSEINETLKGADMVFITAGCGGGTGTGGAPVVAEIAKELGILTVAVVTKPFSFEGTQRAQIAQEGIIKLREQVHTLITIPNDRIFSLISKDTSLIKAFEAIDEVLKNSVLGITELIVAPGIVNVDFADVKAVMNEGGSAIIGVGVANGPERAAKAANLAVNSPLLEASIDGAKGVLFSISGHRDLKMNEINEVAKLISENVDQSAKIIFGAYYDRKLNKGQLKVTLIATGFNGSLPNFFSQKTNLEERAQEELLDQLDQKLIFEETEKKEKPEKKQPEEFWDTPTFLRKKRR
jgi:cell division protein FtsZ